MQTPYVSLIHCAILVVTIQISRAQVNVTSTVDQYKGACPNEKVVFTCMAVGSLVKWTSTTFIGIDQRIQFADFHEVGEGMDSQVLPGGYRSFAQLISKDNTTIITELRVTIPENARRTNSLLVTCTKEDTPEISNMSNPHVTGIISAPRINEPLLLDRNPVTGATSYNLSWEPPFNAVEFDIQRYEVTIGGLKRSTSDTHLIFVIESEDNNNIVAINISVVDRCKRRSSAAMNFTYMVTPTTVSGFAYAYISLGFVICIVTFFVFMIMRMVLFCYAENLPQSNASSPTRKKSPILKTYMVIGTVVSVILFFITLSLLIVAVVQQRKTSLFQHILIFISLLLSIIFLTIESVGMMVLGSIMYTRLEEQ